MIWSHTHQGTILAKNVTLYTLLHCPCPFPLCPDYQPITILLFYGKYPFFYEHLHCQLNFPPIAMPIQPFTTPTLRPVLFEKHHIIKYSTALLSQPTN